MYYVEKRHDGAEPTSNVVAVPNRTRAVEIAQAYCDRPGRSAEIRNGSAQGPVRMRYWRDRDGLQYIEY